MTYLGVMTLSRDLPRGSVSLCGKHPSLVHASYGTLAATSSRLYGCNTFSLLRLKTAMDVSGQLQGVLDSQSGRLAKGHGTDSAETVLPLPHDLVETQKPLRNPADAFSPLRRCARALWYASNRISSYSCRCSGSAPSYASLV